MLIWNPAFSTNSQVNLFLLLRKTILSSTFTAFYLLLLNSKMHYNGSFLTIAFRSVFSEFESKILEVSKIEEDRTQSYVQGKACYIPLSGYLSSLITCISTKLNKMLMLKFVISVLKLEVTENLILSKSFAPWSVKSSSSFLITLVYST